MPSSFIVAFVLGATPGKWARVWRERLPDAPLELVASEQDDALMMLRAGSADAALVRLPIDLGENTERPLARIPLYTERAVVVVPKDHELANADSVTLTEVHAAHLIDEEWRAAVELVAANIGVAIMPQSVARALTRKDVAVQILDDGPQWQIAVAWREGSVDPLVEEFIGIVRGRTARSSRGTAGTIDSEVAETFERSSRASGTKKSATQRAAPRSKPSQQRTFRSTKKRNNRRSR